MYYYLILVGFMLVISLQAYYTFFLLSKAGGSSLYLNISYNGIVCITITLLYFFIYFNHLFNLFIGNYDLVFYTNILFVIFTLLLFKTWEIRFNQLAKQNYKIFIFLLSFVAIGLLFNDKFQYVTIFNQQVTSVLPHIINIFVLGIINVLFLQHNKLAGGIDFKLFPVIILIINLINISLTFLDFNAYVPLVYYIFLLVQSIGFLLLIKMSIDDFKKSFYY